MKNKYPIIWGNQYIPFYWYVPKGAIYEPKNIWCTLGEYIRYTLFYKYVPSTLKAKVMIHLSVSRYTPFYRYVPDTLKNESEDTPLGVVSTYPFTSTYPTVVLKRGSPFGE